MSKSKKIFALVGNPNCGKTTLFNLMTKSREATGNRAGVTVDVKTAEVRKNLASDAIIVDLPGIYSLSPVGNDEKVADEYIKNSPPDAIINIADATNLERSLFLTTELLEKDLPLILILNMADEAKKEKISINLEKLSEKLGVPVVMMSAAKGAGIAELSEKMSGISITGSKKTERKKAHTTLKFHSDAERAAFISRLSQEVCDESEKKNIKEDIFDAVICRKSVGIPLFFLIMICIFALTFSSAGDVLCVLTEKLFLYIVSIIESALFAAGVGNIVTDFVISVIQNGIGSIISLLPRIAILFALIEVLNDSGYMARAAFVMDSPMRALGLSGKSFIPIIMGFGCTVPAVLSSQILDVSERKNVIYSLPFIPCSARFPVFAMITSTFFPNNRVLVSSIIYIAGTAVAYLSLFLMSKGKEAPPLLIEFPKYRAPRISNIIRALNGKIGEFLSRAGSIIFLSSTFIYVLSSMTPSFKLAASAEESILAFAAKKISPLLSPIGLGDFRICAALISGLFAKEAIVSTLGVLGVSELSSLLSLPAAISFTFFILLYPPCTAALSACRYRLGKKGTAIVVARSLIFAYIFSFLAYVAAKVILR